MLEAATELEKAVASEVRRAACSAQKVARDEAKRHSTHCLEGA